MRTSPRKRMFIPCHRRRHTTGPATLPGGWNMRLSMPPAGVCADGSCVTLCQRARGMLDLRTTEGAWCGTVWTSRMTIRPRRRTTKVNGGARVGGSASSNDEPTFSLHHARDLDMEHIHTRNNWRICIYRSKRASLAALCSIGSATMINQQAFYTLHLA